MGLLTRRNVGEISTDWAVGSSTGGIRGALRNFRRHILWPTAPTYGKTKVSYGVTRNLYRNSDKKANLGSFLSKRVIEARADFIDLPHPATGDEVVDEFLETCIHTYWQSEMMQMIRDACRDAETIVRIRRHTMGNKLVSPDEWESCYLEVISPERVQIFYKPNGDRGEIDRAYVRHEIEQLIENLDVSGRSVKLPQVERRVIIEEITATEYRYFDETKGVWRDELQQANSWGFVPLLEVANDFDTSVEGGQSDLEVALPLMFALHDVMGQTLTAHKAHSIPKAKFKIDDVITFLSNNFPDSFEKDENGNVDPTSFNGTVNWKGNEILFMGSEEDADFLEAKSVIGDSTVLMEFLIDCVCMATETPRALLFGAKQGIKNEDEMLPFTKMINRKRRHFLPYIQEICKMVLAINFMTPVRVAVSWDEISPQDALVKAQALQQDVMAHEVLATREVISDRTMRASLSRHIPHMKGNSQEKLDARDNKQLPMISPGSVSGSDSGQNE